MNSITEKNSIERLDANSIKEKSREKIADFMSMFPDMEPEVSMKALEQFPQYATNAAKMLGECRESVSKAIESGDRNLSTILQGRIEMSDALSEMLKTDDLTFEQKMKIAEKMTDLHDRNSGDLDKHQEFMLEIAKILFTVFIGYLTLSIVPLGGRGICKVLRV